MNGQNLVVPVRLVGTFSLALLSSCSVSPAMSHDIAPSSAVVSGDTVWIGAYRGGTHSHNDFDRRRPLIDAIALGIASIEVDVALRDGVFYVTHDSASIRTDRTLTRMFLDPLRELVHGRGGLVYPLPAPPLQLLIDVKSDAGTAYAALDALLATYPGLFTRWTRNQAVPGPVSAILSGRRASDRLREDPDRYLALDGRIWEDRSGFPVSVMPLVSINWDDTMGPGGRWNTAERMRRVIEYVEVVHGEGRLLRFWGTPDQAGLWAELRAVGVDYVGADDIGRLARFVAPDRPADPPTPGMVPRP